MMTPRSHALESLEGPPNSKPNWIALLLIGVALLVGAIFAAGGCSSADKTGPTLTITAPSDVVGMYSISQANSSSPLAASLSGPLKLISACNDVTPMEQGAIAVIEAGNECSLQQQIGNVQSAGAGAAIVLNAASGNKDQARRFEIPVFFVLDADRDAVANAVKAEGVNGRLDAPANKRPFLAPLLQGIVNGVAEPPAVTAVNPPGGSADGGTVVTVSGERFSTDPQLPPAVSFGNAQATGIIVDSDTSLRATTARFAGPGTGLGPFRVDVTVTNPDDSANPGAGVLDAGYTFFRAPIVRTISPMRGSTDGGTVVSLTGDNFYDQRLVDGRVIQPRVNFQSSTTFPATGVAVESGMIRAVTPAHDAGLVSVFVTIDGQTGFLDAGYTYVSVPTVTNVNPNSGSTFGGTVVTVTGTNFVNGQGFKVKFGNEDGSNIVFNGTTSVRARTPSGAQPHPAGKVDVTVINGSPDGQSATIGQAFEYKEPPAPTIRGLFPNRGPAGTRPLISGTGFFKRNETPPDVLFGTSAATGVTWVSERSLLAVAPPGSGKAIVQVTNPDGKSATFDGFTYGDSGRKSGCSSTGGGNVPSGLALLLAIGCTLGRRRRTASQ